MGWLGGAKAKMLTKVFDLVVSLKAIHAGFAHPDVTSFCAEVGPVYRIQGLSCPSPSLWVVTVALATNLMHRGASKAHDKSMRLTGKLICLNVVGNLAQHVG